MQFTSWLLAGAAIGFGVFCTLTGAGAALKIVQWIGKKLGVKAFDV